MTEVRTDGDACNSCKRLEYGDAKMTERPVVIPTEELQFKCRTHGCDEKVKTKMGLGGWCEKHRREELGRRKTKRLLKPLKPTPQETVSEKIQDAYDRVDDAEDELKIARAQLRELLSKALDALPVP